MSTVMCKLCSRLEFTGQGDRANSYCTNFWE